MTTQMENNKSNLSKFRIWIVAAVTTMIIVIILFLTWFSISRLEQEVKRQHMTMAKEVADLMMLNLDNYMDTLEGTATLIYATPEAYTYDATNPGMEEYDALKTESIISDALYNVGIMQNYVDFGIVYRNNHMVGKMSNGTKNLFGDDLFLGLESIVSDELSQDGWKVGLNDDYKRIYYVKRIQDNVVFVSSFYATELDYVFTLPQEMSDISVFLTDGNNHVIYAENCDKDIKSGSDLPEYITSRTVSNFTGATVDSQYMIVAKGNDQGWSVVLSSETESITSSVRNNEKYIFIADLLMILIAVLGILFVTRKVSNPIRMIVENLDNKASTDSLTGLINKKSFEAIVEDALSKPEDKDYHAFLLIDVDNFKNVNDKQGHAAGDKVLTRIAEIITAQFRTQDRIGRIGGDEFAVFFDFPFAGDEYRFTSLVREKSQALCDAMKYDMVLKNTLNVDVSVSVGISIAPAHGKDFQTLYERADQALYKAKEKGKNCFEFYELKEEKPQQE